MDGRRSARKMQNSTDWPRSVPTSGFSTSSPSRIAVKMVGVHFVSSSLAQCCLVIGLSSSRSPGSSDRWSSTKCRGCVHHQCFFQQREKTQPECALANVLASEPTRTSISEPSPPASDGTPTEPAAQHTSQRCQLLPESKLRAFQACPAGSPPRFRKLPLLPQSFLQWTPTASHIAHRSVA